MIDRNCDRPKLCVVKNGIKVKTEFRINRYRRTCTKCNSLKFEDENLQDCKKKKKDCFKITTIIRDCIRIN